MRDVTVEAMVGECTVCVSVELIRAVTSPRLGLSTRTRSSYIPAIVFVRMK